jgi:hypothetical protein
MNIPHMEVNSKNAFENKEVCEMSENPASNIGILRISGKAIIPGNIIETYRGLKSRL